MKLNVGDQIIDSQSLTVAILASLLFGESIGFVGGTGLVLGVMGHLLLEVNIDAPSCKCKMLLSLGLFFNSSILASNISFNCRLLIVGVVLGIRQL